MRFAISVIQWPTNWGRQGTPSLLRTPRDKDKAAAPKTGEDKPRFLIVKMSPGGLETFEIDALPESFTGKGTPFGPSGSSEVSVASNREAELLDKLALPPSGWSQSLSNDCTLAAESLNNYCQRPRLCSFGVLYCA